MMTMPLAVQRVLSVSSVKNGPTIHIPASSLSSPQFATFSGLSVEKRFSDLCIAETPLRRNHDCSLIEAREPTRRERVKTRHLRIRKRCNGTPERPRLCVFRSNKHIYVQVIDDTSMHTLASASTLLPGLREELQLTSGPTIVAATRVGEEVAKACLEKGISKVAFDRGGFLYHGRIKAVADGARSAGLDF